MATAGTQPKKSPNAISNMIVDAAMKVHTALGPGLLGSTYAACLSQELRDRGLEVRTEVALPVFYEGLKLEIGYCVDMLVEDLVIVELKSIDGIAPIHQAQVLSYLKLSSRSLGSVDQFQRGSSQGRHPAIRGQWLAMTLCGAFVSFVVSFS